MDKILKERYESLCRELSYLLDVPYNELLKYIDKLREQKEDK